MVISYGTGLSQTAIDARPIRPMSDGTLWDAACRRRDEIERIARATLEKEGIQALVIASGRGNFPPWVKLEAWLPVTHQLVKGGTESERVLLEFLIEIKPYHEREIVTTASLWRGNRKIAVTERPEFSVENCAEWVCHALGSGPRPSNYRPVRDALRTAVRAFLPFLSPPHRNRIRREFRSGLSRAGLLGIAAVLLLAAGSTLAGLTPAVTVIAMILGIILIVAAAVAVSRRQEVVALVHQPIASPRNLALLDSWHAVIAGLGADFALARHRLFDAVTQYLPADIDVANELYGYRTPNGYEERERLVVSKGQSMVMLHISPFGNDIFVGWQASLNCSKWDEKRTVSTRVSGNKITRFVELGPADYQPSQFDLIDLNSLSELVHRRLEREIKAILKEKKIDQEIDFQIIRGSRDTALASGDKADKNKKKSGWTYSAKAG